MNSPYSRNYPSLYRGIVENNIDPENLGRCKVRVPSVHGELLYPIDILPWARPLVLSPVSKGRGSVNLPDIGDIVWVLFEGSNKEFPVYLGGTYATEDIEINHDIVDFYIEEDDKISYDRKNRIFEIKIGDTVIKVYNEKVEVLGNLEISGSLSVSNNLKVDGDTILNNLTVRGSFNKGE